jgi:hypothetical protein
MLEIGKGLDVLEIGVNDGTVACSEVMAGIELIGVVIMG